MNIDFVKMHGLGNDFIVIDDRDEQLDFSEDAVAWICDRNFGVGADGMMLVRPATVEGADFAWWFRNSDGSVAEMCGNGIRCFAKYLVDHKLLADDVDSVKVQTDRGVLEITVTRDYAGRMSLATVDMGEPILTPALIPTTLGCDAPDDPVIGCELDTDAGSFAVTCVSMGNPHCVIFVDDVDAFPVHKVGPVIEHDPRFPKRTNVEFAHILGDDTIELRVWERGVGETLACGTGACATAVAAALTCQAGRETSVVLPGGVLEIRWAADGHVFMTGPAEEVFSGTLSVLDDDA